MERNRSTAKSQSSLQKILKGESSTKPVKAHQRGVSAKGQRHQLARKKYEMFQNRRDKLETMENILTGNEQQRVTPKPGSIMIPTASMKRLQAQSELGDGIIGLEEFLESQRKHGAGGGSQAPPSVGGTSFVASRIRSGRKNTITDLEVNQSRNKLPPLGVSRKDQDMMGSDEEDFIQNAGTKSFAQSDLEGIVARGDPMRQSHDPSSLMHSVRKGVLSKDASTPDMHKRKGTIQYTNDDAMSSHFDKSMRSTGYVALGLNKQRSPSKKSTHSYSKVSTSKGAPSHLSKKAMRQSIDQHIPDLVQKQQEYIKGKVRASPFMAEQVIPPLVIKEPAAKILGRADPQPGPSKEEVLSMRFTNNYNDRKKLGEKLSPERSAAGGGQGLNIIDQERVQEMNSKRFLPVDSYDPFIDSEDPLSMIESNRDPRTDKCYGKSKWFFANGEYEMRACEVLGYDDSTERFLIKWVGKDNQKQVSRLNLIFRNESEEDFKRRIEEAQVHRANAELIMKYNYLIEKTETRPIELSDNKKSRISMYIQNFQPININYRNPLDFLNRSAESRYTIPLSQTVPRPMDIDLDRLLLLMKAKGFDLAYFKQLFDEVDEDYYKAHQQIEFDFQLPYSAERYEMLKDILPKEKFIPVQERIPNEEQKKGVIEIPERSAPFKDVLEKMSGRLHQANVEKLKSLQKMNVKLISFSDFCFFETTFPNGPVSKEIFQKLNRTCSLDLIREVRNAMFDSQYEVVHMVTRELAKVKERNEQRRKAASYESKPFKEETLSPPFVNDMTQYQFLLNFVYERSIRECFEGSFIKMIESYQQILVNIKRSIEVEQVVELKVKMEGSQAGQEIQQENQEEQIRTDHVIDLNNLLTIAQDAVFWKRVKDRQVLKIEVKYSDKDKIYFDPPLEEWRKQILDLERNAGEEINNVPCFYATEIGYARESMRIKVLEENDFFVVEKESELNSILDQIFTFPQTLQALLNQYAYLLDIDIKKYKRDYKNHDYPVEKYQQELKVYKAAQDHLEQILYDQSHLLMGLFEVKCTKLRSQFLSRLEDLNSVLFTCVKKKINENNKQIEEEVDKILAVIQKEPKDIEELTSMREFIKDLRNKMDGIEKAIKEVMNKMSLLEEHQYYLQEDEFKQTWVSFSRPLDISRARWDCERRMKSDEKDFFEDLRVMTQGLAEEFEDIKVEYEIIQNVEALDDHHRASSQCEQLFDRFENAIETSEIVNRREDLFKLRLTNYQEIVKTKNEFMAYYTMWMLAREYYFRIDIWMNGVLGEIDRDVITREVNEACQTLMKSEKIDFREKRHTALIASQLRQLYEGFKPYLPIICDLRNPGLKARHWENIQEVTGIELDGELAICMNELIKKGIMKFQEQINEVSDYATREAKLEEAIFKMRDEWRNVKFEINEFRSSETHVLKQVEPIWELLDEHIVKTMAIASSPYIKFLAAEVNSWKNTLLRVQEILEEWSKTQRGWLYLWPIFSSEDIQRQMPTLSQSFQSVDRVWRTIMANTQSNLHVLDACSYHKIYEQFLQCNDAIDRIQKGLNDYLNTKRMAFPRFFFLSNDDLLSILSQTKEPTRVQDHMNKCFEGIQELKFDEDKTIHGMYSALGEYIGFEQIINPFDEETKEVRPVELWLKEVEDQMRESLKCVHERAYQDYTDEKRCDWIRKWSGQAVLTINEVIWTSNIEDAFKRNALKQVFEAEQRKLLELVEVIKQELSETEVMTFGSMIVLDVHGKDVIQDLIDADITNDEQFEWISQLRYYMVYQSKKGSDGEMVKELSIDVKMVNTVREYGFEYLGNQPRLVITPLTDRCYRTLMGALQLNLGGAPEGPAGTGKTETTKDLSKAIAKQCIVFNCSDQLDVAAMSKFFKGLACCGAWACFDEFNRIELEVLSVIASQILTIQNALMRRRAATPFQFEDTQILLNPQCAVFITMNPGYAGRSDLPDNLKALFRPVAMMIPNYNMIAEILLYSFGFSMARDLSIKITQSLRLSSEQLSTQGHYDYGMRAVKSIVMAAGGLKRKLPDLDESQIVLRAICDCNIPKFISDDIPLFEGIVSDLFPTTVKEQPDYGLLNSCILEMIEKRGLQRNREFMVKVVQLYETVQVRHGLMLVGQTMCGKTQVLHTLAQAITRTNEIEAIGDEGKVDELIDEPSVGPEEQNQTQGDAPKATDQSVISHQSTLKKINYPQVIVNTINPKSISIGSLYGDFDKITHDWTDGILAVTVRDCARDKSSNKRWITLDGPVDAVWVENLNTVLDDNKKLCLSSGEIIKFTPHMTMMFEVEDLQEASPATVSRCGMVYMEPERLGWEALVPSWVLSLPESMRNEERKVLMEEMVVKLIKEVFEFVMTEETKWIVPITHNWLVHSCLKLFQSNMMGDLTINDILNQEEEQRDKDEAKRHFQRLAGLPEDPPGAGIPKMTNEEKSHMFMDLWIAIIWSIGACLREESRAPFNAQLHDLQQKVLNTKFFGFSDQLDKRMLLETDKNYFDFTYLKERGCWNKWDNMIPLNIQIPEDAEFQEILVPTMDTARYSHYLNILTIHSFPVLFVGNTGTGKTQMMKRFVFDLPKESWEQGNMIFSATTSAQMVQQYIEKKVEKRKRGVYGPIVGKTLAVFIDDLNMPAKEKYGAQPPIEMVRQIMESGFYEFKNLSFCQVVDTVMIGAMGTPGGGKTMLSKRLTRRFNLIHIPDFSNDNLQKIFSTILEWGFTGHLDQIRKQIKTIIKSTITLYNHVSTELLPLPSKSHYTFNLRSIAEVVQGMTHLHIKTMNEKEQKLMYLHKLWVHECMRVFTDRLTSYEDRDIVISLIKQSADESGFKIDFDRIEPEKIVFNNFKGFVPGKLDLIYDEVDPNSEDSIKQIENILSFYNQFNKDKINLLIFEYVVQHLSRLARIIAKPYGNALLIGIGGNGRKCLSKLAAFFAECQTFRLEMSKNYGRLEWIDDMKTLYKNLGLDNKKVAFMFQDTDIKHESFIEDVNNILNTGEVPNLFPLDEREDISYEMQKILNQKGANLHEMFEAFLTRCKKNLHLCIFMSPAGDMLRQYIRLYPSLVNCATIDWFMQWPDEALKKVAVHFLSDFEKEDEQLDKIVQLCVKSHQTIQGLCTQYFQEKQRQVYITPTRFLELLDIFKTIIAQKHSQIDKQIDKYEVGVQKLDEANTKIDAMKLKLQELRPILEEKTKQADSTLVKLEKEGKEVEAVKAVVEKEEEQVLAQKDHAEGIKTECQAKLDQAMPMLNEAIEALRTLKTNDFVQMKSYKSPPYLIVLVLEAACIMLGMTPKMVEQQVGKEKKKVPDYWEKAKKLLNDYKKFIQSLEKYDRDNIPEDRIEKIQEYLNNPKFDPPVIRKASEAAEGICKWVIAICKYDIVAKDVRPRKLALNEASEKLEVVMAQLKEKQAQLQEIIDKKNALEEEFKAQNFEKQTLNSQIEECKVKLDRALRLTGSLGKERGRWIKNAEKLRVDKTNLLGNVILSSAVISYLGPFNDAYRNKIIQAQWIPACLNVEINIDEDFSLEKTVGDAMEIQSWKLKNLPADQVSVENMIIIKHTPEKWPLLIDPQSQALKFLKGFKEKHVNIKLSTEDYQKKLESAIFMGETVICEEVQETLDTGIMAVVSKDLYEVNGDKYLKINDTQIDYNQNFRFYMITNHSNPHFSPDIHTKTRILNFSITKNGLEQQLLSVVCRNESAKDEDERDKLIKQNAEFKIKKQEIENLILEQLRNSGDDILEDETLINSCNESKKITEDIKAKLKSAKTVEERIEENRNNYFPVAKMATTLFFCVSDLHVLDPMYQYSMKWFRDLFSKSFIKEVIKLEDGQEIVEKKKSVKERVKDLIERFRKILYQNVCRSLFEKHKLMFSFFMSLKIYEQEIDQRELRYLLTGLAETEPEDKMNTCSELLDAKQWKQILELSQLDNFESIVPQLEDNAYEWKQWMETQDTMQSAHQSQIMSARKGSDLNESLAALDRSTLHMSYIPGSYQGLNPFSRILLYKVLKPDQVVNQIKQYIGQTLGEYFITPPQMSLKEAFNDSSEKIPLVFILTPGNDPMSDLQKFSDEMGKFLVPISMGKGQGEKAREAIIENMETGQWVILQNCHLAASWLPELEVLIEKISMLPQESTDKKDNFPNQINPQFRLWLTSMPSDVFPTSVLQNGVKMTNEPPRGVKENLIRQFRIMKSSKADVEFYNSNAKPDEWKTLFMSLTYFHAIVRERNKFGPLGWNLKYDFNDSDYKISMRQLHLMVGQFSIIPYKALLYLTGECNYGGRVTDDWDRRTLNTILKDFYSQDVFTQNDYQILPVDEYVLPSFKDLEPEEKEQGITLDHYIKFISTLPDQETPVLFGLHENANITYAIHESSAITSDILQMTSTSGSGDTSKENELIRKLASDIKQQIPQVFKIKEVEAKYPFLYEESMNTVLLQELYRFNRLIEVIQTSINGLEKTLDGLQLMTTDMEQMLSAFKSNSVPSMWAAKAYPSRKPLISWTKDLVKRLQMLQEWIDRGQPSVFWISGFFFTQSFLTGVKQNYARKYKYPIDEIDFEFEVQKSHDLIGGKAPTDGCYIKGLFLDGAGWDILDSRLKEMEPKVLNIEMPIIYLKPVKMEKQQQKNTQRGDSSQVYDSPVYKTSQRAGTLSTTGHSTNYIMTMQLPSDQDSSHWIKRSVALLTQLDD